MTLMVRSARRFQYLPNALLTALCLTNTAVRADLILNTASWSASGSVYVDSGVFPQIHGSDFQQAIGPAHVDGRVDETLEKRNSNGTLLGSARARATFTALAETASLHVGLHGFVEAINNPSTAPSPLNKGYGSANLSTSSSIARWQDTATISAPGPAGRLIYVYGLLVLDGEMSVDAEGDLADNRDAQALFQLTLNGAGLQPGSYGSNYFGNYFDSISHTGRVEGPPPPVISTLLLMKNGEPYTIDYSMSLSVRASAASNALTDGAAQASFDGDFTHTLNWGGITRVTDAGGTPITGWTISSASGVDYTHAVPEPASIFLLMLSGMGRRRKRGARTVQRVR